MSFRKTSSIACSITSVIFLTSIQCLPYNSVDNELDGSNSSAQTITSLAGKYIDENLKEASNIITSDLKRLKEEYLSSGNLKRIKNLVRNLFDDCSSENVSLCVKLKAAKVLNRALVTNEIDIGGYKLKRNADVDISQFDPAGIESARGVDSSQREQKVEQMIQKQLAALVSTRSLTSKDSSSFPGNIFVSLLLF